MPYTTRGLGQLLNRLSCYITTYLTVPPIALLQPQQSIRLVAIIGISRPSFIKKPCIDLDISQQLTNFLYLYIKVTKSQTHSRVKLLIIRNQKFIQAQKSLPLQIPDIVWYPRCLCIVSYLRALSLKVMDKWLLLSLTLVRAALQSKSIYKGVDINHSSTNIVDLGPITSCYFPIPPYLYLKEDIRSYSYYAWIHTANHRSYTLLPLVSLSQFRYRQVIHYLSFQRPVTGQSLLVLIPESR